MPQTTHTRYTIVISWTANALTPVAYGVFSSYDRARAQCDAWTRIIEKRYPHAMIDVVPLKPAAGARFRGDLEQHAKVWTAS